MATTGDHRSQPRRIEGTPSPPSAESSDANLGGLYILSGCKTDDNNTAADCDLRGGSGRSAHITSQPDSTSLETITEYTAEVPYYVGMVTVWPIVNEMHANVEVEPTQRGVQGRSWRQVDLEERGVLKTIRIRVTAHDGSTQKTYQVEVMRRKPSDASLRDLVVHDDNSNLVTLEPDFVHDIDAPSIVIHTASVDNSVSSVTVTPTVNMTGATVMADGKSLGSGSTTSPLTWPPAGPGLSILW